MTDNIEELNKFHDILTSKIGQFNNISGKELTVKNLKKNLKLVEDKIKEVKGED